MGLRILHIIDSLSNGGAEMLLMNAVTLLTDHEHIVVYLHEPESMKAQCKSSSVRFINLHVPGVKNLFRGYRSLKALIETEQPSLVHSHLIMATLVARIATPKHIPLFSTIHSIYSLDAFSKNRKSLLAERWFIRNRHHLIGVSQFVLQDYLSHVPFRGERFVLYNFLPDSFFDPVVKPPSQEGVFRCVAVGNLKEAKNYSYMLEMIRHLKKEGIQLDIYGERGGQEEAIAKTIRQEHLPVRLCGRVNDIREVLPQYDLFLQASEHEGFGLSVIEAIALKVPVFISDIPVFREITNGSAHFFPLDDPQQAAILLQQLQINKAKREQYVEGAYVFAQSNFCGSQYAHRLSEIYNTALTIGKRTVKAPEDDNKLLSLPPNN